MNKYTRIRLILYTLLFVICWTSCKKDEFERTFPRVVTSQVTDIVEDEGAVFHGKITFFGSTPVEDYGFIWSKGTPPTFENSRVRSLGSTNKSGPFSFQIFTTLEQGRVYYVRAFARYQGVVVYGNVVSFKSLGSDGPKLLAIQPQHADLGDTILIIGEQFSDIVAENVVKFDKVPAKVIAAALDTLQVVVPNVLTTASPDISVSILGNKNVLKNVFKLNPPRIEKVNADSLFVGDKLIITGKNFIPGETYVYLESLLVATRLLRSNSSYPKPVTENKITFNLPSTLLAPKGNGTLEWQEETPIPYGWLNVKVKVFDQDSNQDSIFNDTPGLLDFSPKEVNLFDTITVYGRHFDKITSLKIDGIKVNPTLYKDTAFSAVVPLVSSPSPDISIYINYKGRNFYLSNEQPLLINPFYISSLSDTTGLFGSKITIYGRNFLKNSTVYFGSFLDNNIGKSIVYGDSIRAEVPDISTDPVPVSVALGYSNNQFVSSTAKFQLIPPSLSSISKTFVEVSDTLTIWGNFSPKLSYNHVYLDNYSYFQDSKLEIIEGNSDYLKLTFIRMPDYKIAPHGIGVKVGRYNAELPGVLKIKEPELTSVNPNLVGLEDVVSIRGYFPLIRNRFHGKVTVYDKQAEFLSVKKDELLIRIIDYIPYGTHDLKLNIGYKNYILKDSLQFPWYFRSPYNELDKGDLTNSFVIGDNLYFLEGLNLFIYKRLSGGYSSNVAKATLPYTTSEYAMAFRPFVIGQKAYFGIQSDSSVLFWEYDADLDSWSEKASLPASFARGFSLAINGNGIVGCGLPVNTTDRGRMVWEYNPLMDTWSQKSDFPEVFSFEPVATSNNSEGYLAGIASGSVEIGVWQYDYTNDTWQLIASQNFCGEEALLFINNNKLYIVGGCLYKMWEIDLATHKFLPAPRPPLSTIKNPGQHKLFSVHQYQNKNVLLVREEINNNNYINILYYDPLGL